MIKKYLKQIYTKIVISIKKDYDNENIKVVTRVPKNKLGHDDESEILTLVKRMQEANGRQFSLLYADVDSFSFSIKLDHINLCAGVQLDSSTNASYIIKRKYDDTSVKYLFSQINGIPEREIDKINGFIIWSLLEERYSKKTQNKK
jgi:hypothetical protein